MVKKLSTIIIIIIIIASCNRKQNNYIIEKDNNYVVFWNFKEGKTIEMFMNNTYENIKLKSFSANKIESKHRIQDKLQNQLLVLYYDAYNQHFKDVLKKESRYSEIKYNSNSLKPKLYFIGKQEFVRNIDSYLAIKIDTIINRKTSNKTIILFNFKQKKLRSIVELSSFVHGVDDSSEIATYFSDDLFTQRQNINVLFLPMELYSDLNIDIDKSNFIRLSQFKMDKDGYVQLW